MEPRVGIEVLSSKSIQDSLEGFGDAFLQKSFTDWERSRAKQQLLPINYYSRLLSAKEAIRRLFKEGSGILPTEIEIRDGKLGEPVPCFTGKIKRIMDSRGQSRLSLNVCEEDGFAVAVAVLE